ncbi:FkbM family methyltransferase [Methanoregula sp.]|uniref:FkbM family methyltransferase n=1 Tax=Methanoregula sp. TaxID=2052170 RepID=UPI003563C716
MVEQLSPYYIQKTRYGDITFFCFGEIPLYRAESLLTKEPETIEWIDSFETGDILWDIGANVGCYTLYAAKKGVFVKAFEPSAANYFLLQKNTEINRLDSMIQAFCIAFSDVSETGYLNMSSIQMGGAINAFGNAAKKIEFMEDSWEVKFQQGMLGFSIDEFIRIFQVPAPNHIKIDVDGIEDKIIRGARQTLQDKRVKSVLIEIDDNQTEYNAGITRILEDAGFTLSSKKHAPMFDAGKFASMYNCVFTRK